jgi:hypothetical protein
MACSQQLRIAIAEDATLQAVDVKTTEHSRKSQSSSPISRALHALHQAGWIEHLGKDFD